MTIHQLAQKCGKNKPFILTLQRTFSLPTLKDYKPGYVMLVKKLIWLQIASVPKRDIMLQLKRERKLLELLHFNSIEHSPSWFEDSCKSNWGPGHLLLSGHATGDIDGIQTGLNFTERDTELFASSEMGDDSLLALQLCLDSQDLILERILVEQQALTSALRWTRKITR